MWLARYPRIDFDSFGTVRILPPYLLLPQVHPSRNSRTLASADIFPALRLGSVDGTAPRYVVIILKAAVNVLSLIPGIANDKSPKLGPQLKSIQLPY